ncbi:MAG TPA: sugar phosphate isomerase/epimerase family protein [Planctomycetaceae bacterium]|nr:sugar phosphate isomerase/epimerase family protein [Planctomycetaceae bacterium]
MKLSFLFYEPIPDLAELDRRMERLAAMGYQGIELSACHPPPYPADDLLRLAERRQMPVVSFLSGWSYGHEKLCLASPDAQIRERAVARLCSYIDYAAPLQAVLVVGLMQGLRSDEPDGALAADRIAECLRRVSDRAAKVGATLVLEPVNHLQVGFHHTAAEAAALVERVGSGALSYMLDTIHLHIEERSVRATILKHGKRIRHFHLCESNGGPFGSGAIDFPQVLAALRESGYDKFLSVKIYRQLAWEEAARNAAEKILPLMK